MEDLKQIEKTLVEKIDGLMTKVNDEKASKDDMVALNKTVLNLKASIAAQGEDAERDTKQYRTKYLSSKEKKSLGSALTKAMDLHNTWDRMPSSTGVSSKAFRENFVAKNTNINEYDATAGAGMLQTIVDPIIHKIIGLYAVGRNNCRIYDGLHGPVKLNSRSALPSFGRTLTTGAVRDDALVTASAPTYSNITVTPSQSAGWCPITEKLLWDNVPNVMEDAAEDLAEAAALAEDNELFLGDGTGTYNSFTGLNTATIGYGNKTVNVRNGSFTNFDPLLQLQQAVHPSVVRSGNCKYFMHPFTFALLSTFKASTSGWYFYDISTNTFKVAGSEIVFSQVMDVPSADLATFAIGKVPVIYGDMKKAITLGIGRDMQLKVFDQTLAQNNEIALRLCYDVGFGIQLPAGISRINVVS